MLVVNVTNRSGRGRSRLGRAHVVGLALAMVLAVVGSSGCAKHPVAPPPVAPPSEQVHEYRVQPGDVVDVKFLYHPNENQRLGIRPDGNLALPITGDLMVMGLTVDELEELIRTRASRRLREPVVTVTIAETSARAYIGGEISNAGFVQLGKPMDVVQAIFERGGFRTTADLTKVTVLSRGKPGVRRIVNLENAVKGEPVDSLMLEPDDVVFVPKTWIATADSWVKSWLDGLTPEILKSVRVPASSL
jgi:protein involved in polysaccharide export with SLBB domain